MNGFTTEEFTKAYAASALALLSAIYTTEDISEQHRADIEQAVATAPVDILFTAAKVKHIFMEKS